MEDCGTMPSLQELLDEFDETRLEELAENLLADVIPDFTSDVTESCQRNAKIQSSTERLSGPMVGSETANMDSTENINNCLSRTTDLPASRVQIKMDPDTFINQSPPKLQIIKSEPMSTDTETVYGNYDESSKCITIVLPNESIPFNEAVEEIVSDEDQMSDVSLLSPIQNLCPSSTPSSPGYCSIDSFPAEQKSPISVHSNNESGYESVGSPGNFDFNFGELWSSPLSELFPSLY